MPETDSTGVRSGTRSRDMSAADSERPWNLRESYLFDRTVIAEIQRAATSVMIGDASQPVACTFRDTLVAWAEVGATTNAMRSAGLTAFEKLLR